jgi:hypothetical protein
MSGNLYKKDHTPTTPGYAHAFNAPGLRNVGSYQASGVPWITGSDDLDSGDVHMVQFPRVPKSFTVINTSANSGENIRVHFQSGSGVTAVTVPGHVGAQTITTAADVIRNFHYITVPPGYSSATFDVKCRQVYVSNLSGDNDLSYEVLAELTNIPRERMYHLTGSGITECNIPVSLSAPNFNTDEDSSGS